MKKITWFGPGKCGRLKGAWLSSKLKNNRPKSEKNVRAQVETYNYLKTQYDNPN